MLLVLMLAACACSNPSRPPDVILVILDAAAAGHASLYGYMRRTTPQIDAFAREAIVWERAYAQAPQTTNSVASLMTGRYPVDAWSKKQVSGATLAEALQARGYRTVAISENPWITKSNGFARGFDEFRVVRKKPPPPSADVVELADRPTIAEALAEFDTGRENPESPQRPLFLYLHLLPPHSPYDPPPQFRGRFAPLDADDDHTGFLAITLRGTGGPEDIPNFRDVFSGVASLSSAEADLLRARYDENLAYADARVGELLAGLRARDRLDESIVILSADHGEAFGQHGRFLHGSSLYNVQIRVPLIMRLPHAARYADVARGHRGDPVQLADLAATILELVGREVGPAGPGVKRPAGRSLLDPARTGHEPVRSFLSDRRQAVIVGRYKLIATQGRPPRLYDLVSDPAEHSDLAPNHPETVASFAELLWAVGEPEVSPDLDDVDKTTRERLKVLGYIEEGP